MGEGRNRTRKGGKSYDRIIQHIRGEISFHTAIAEASRNRMLGVFAGSIHMTSKTLAESYAIPVDVLPEVKRISQEQHRLICEAISEKDRNLAASRMREHLQLSYEVYEQAMPRGRPGSIGMQPQAGS